MAIFDPFWAKNDPEHPKKPKIHKKRTDTFVVTTLVDLLRIVAASGEWTDSNRFNILVKIMKKPRFT